MKSIKTSIEDLLQLLEGIRREIPAKKEITEQEVIQRLENTNYGIYKVIDSISVQGLWCMVRRHSWRCILMVMYQ